MMTRLQFILICAALLGAGCKPRTPSVHVPYVEVKKEKFQRIIDADGNLRPTKSTPVAVPGDVPWQLRATWLAPDGSVVKKGDLVASFDEQELRTNLLKAQSERSVALSQKEKEVITLQTASRDRTRVASASERELTMSQDFARKDPEIYSHDEMIEGEIDQKLQQAKVEFYKRSGATDRVLGERKLGLRDVEIKKTEEQVKRTEKGLSSLQLRAPHDGVLSLNRNDRGEVFRVGDSAYRRMTIAEVSRVETLEAEVFVLEAEAAGLAVGRRAEVLIESRSERPFAATIKSVESVPKRRQQKSPTQYFGVVLELAKTEPDIMKSGQRVAARLFLHEEETLVVPRPTVFDREGRFVVYRLEPSGSFAQVAVKLGASTAGRVAIASGLREGDHIALRDPGKSVDDLVPTATAAK